MTVETVNESTNDVQNDALADDFFNCLFPPSCVYFPVVFHPRNLRGCKKQVPEDEYVHSWTVELL